MNQLVPDAESLKRALNPTEVHTEVERTRDALLRHGVYVLKTADCVGRSPLQRLYVFLFIELKKIDAEVIFDCHRPGDSGVNTDINHTLPPPPAFACASVDLLSVRHCEICVFVLSPSTIRGYQIIRDNHFKDVMDCDAFSDVDYQKTVNDAAAKYSPKTIKNDWGLVTAALRYAKIEPPDINLPQKVVKELPWLSYTQIQQFLDIIKGEPCELPALLALHSLRRSELLDLERADISEDCITVRGSRVPNNKNRLVHKETNKTSASTRTVPIVIPRLKEILPNEDGYLIRCYCNTPTIQINRLCRANNLPEVGLHGLRRSFASLAHHLGWDVRTTMRYGGWSDYKTMNDFYIKLDETDLIRDATKMVEFYSGAVS